MKQIDLALPITAYRDGDNILVSQMRFASLIMGTASVVGNESMYGIHKRADGFVVIPISSIRKERKKFADRINVLNAKLKLADTILNGV